MNKYALIAALAAAATMTGCLDPNYVRPGDRNNKGADVANAKTDETGPRSEATPSPDANKDTEIAVTEAKCTCPAGTKHTAPCGCGAKDCKCEVVKADTPAPADETTVYYVQRGDNLSKISKKFNVKIDAIRKLNPKIKGDKILVGQKLLLPGKLDVGKAAEKPAAPKAESTKKVAPAKFEGETKEYVVKKDDCLGKIAVASGITIAQLKELNGLSSDNIRAGQKLKVPAVKQEAKKPEAKKDPKKTVANKDEKKPVAKTDEKKPVEQKVQAKPAPADESKQKEESAAAKDAAPAPAPAQATYKLREGEDILELSINWGVSPAEIREANGMAPEEELKPGQTIKVPAGVKL
jgi:LysM repeat protein